MTSNSSKPLPTVYGWSDNKLKFNNLSLTFTIGDFTSRPYVILSGAFPKGNDYDTKWEVEIHPYGRCTENRDFVSLFLVLNQSKKFRVSAKFKFSIPQTNIKFSSEIMEFCAKNSDGLLSQRHGIEKFVERSFLLDENNGLLSNGKLTIYCEVRVIVDTMATSHQQKSTNVPKCSLSDDFAQLLRTSNFSDCTLMAGGKEFKVHKNILSARSPVFEAMFRDGMKEAELETPIEIPDIDANVMSEMLLFIYTGKTPNLEQFATGLLAAADKYQFDRLKVLCENAMVSSAPQQNACEMGLLAAADKYQLDRLKALCENAMFNSISPENACEMLVLSHLHSADQLKAYAIRYIVTHTHAVMETQGWQQLLMHHHKLVTELCLAKHCD